MTAPTAEARRLAQLARANRPNPAATTQPGSETTNFTVGDAVQVRRETVSTGTWSRYDGRNGWVAAVNRQQFPSGVNYVEIGVSWTQPTDARNPATNVWFRADELKSR